MTAMTAGSLVAGGAVRVTRNAQAIYDGEEFCAAVRLCANLDSGTILSLRHHKDIVSEAKKDSECGITFCDWDGFEIGD
jgi:translation initiation factor IF-2